MYEENQTLKKLHQIGIIPAIVLDDVKDAAPLAEALCKGGLPAAEVTFRTACAHDAMIAMKKARPDLIVGAGTVLTKEQVDAAVDAGAQFIVSPGLNPEIVRYVQSKGIPMIPGIATASEMEQALSLGLHTVKFFPAEAMGGLKTIKALCGPYRNMTFLPTGGINTDNMMPYLKDPKIFAVGGTWMVKPDLIKAGKFDEIEQISRQAVKKMLDVRLVHIGINTAEGSSKETADAFAALLNGEIRETSKGYFATDMIEIMARNHKGSHGHIAIGVSSVERAMHYYESIGYAFDPETIQYDENHEAKFAYFRDEMAGFGIHLIND